MSHIIEIEFYTESKWGQLTSGDTFLAAKTNDERIVATLADGMGSGVKANILSGLTASMSQTFMKSEIEHVRLANRIMEILPVCSKRKISYSTFTSLNISPNGETEIIEYDNPELIHFRQNTTVKIKRNFSKIITNTTRNKMSYAQVRLQYGDRLVFFSDGVTQAGMGSNAYPFGWKQENAEKFIREEISKNKNISAKELAKIVVRRAKQIDAFYPKDDITCAVAYYRQARELTVFTGPPFDSKKDNYLIERFKEAKGKKIICGGTTSLIISKGIQKEVTVDMFDLHSDIPPRSQMEGVDLVTEGMLTINKVIKILTDKEAKSGKDAAYKMTELLLNSDKIYFLVGTAINIAHQNPDMPIEMGLRRISIQNLAKILKEKYLKQVTIEYL